MNRLLRFTFGAGLFVAVLCASGCATDVQIDPTGYKCDPGDVCPDGFTCVSGTCRQDGNLCAGVSCGDLPANTCKDANTLLSYGSSGTCQADTGLCSYPSTEISCAQGCQDGRCVGDACAGVSCVQPPASTCVSGTTLRTYSAVGTCAPSTGSCDYAPTDVTCPGGCANGTCQGDNLCESVTCNAPPASTCSGNTLVTFASSGQCDSASGQCTYASTMAACPGGCSNGACIAPNAKTFKQIGPRLLSAITAVDVTASSPGNVVLAVGPSGFVSRWNGTEWTTLSSGTTRDLTSVWLRSPTQGFVVGKGGTVLRYDGTSLTAVTLPGSPGNLVSVHGNGTHVIIADANGNVWRSSNGSSFTQAPAPTGFSSYQMVQAYVDADGSERVAGLCRGTVLDRPCVLYAADSTATSWYVDPNGLGTLQSTGFSAVGPSLDTGHALLSQGTSVYRHDGDTGTVDSTNVPTGLTGSEVRGITEDSASSVFILTGADSSNYGKLFRWQTGSSAMSLLTLYGTAQSMSRNDVGGVVIADSGPSGANVFRRGPITNEALELNEDWVDVELSPSGARLMINGYADVAAIDSGASTFRFERSPASSPDFVGLIAGQSYALMFGGGGKLYRWSPSGGFTTVAGSGSSDWLAGCRNSDAEVFVVGAGGKLAKYNGSALTVMTSPTSADLEAVTCAGAGKAFAVGANGTVLKVSGSTWSTVSGAPSSATLTGAYAAASGELFVAGDNVLLRYANGAWSSLPGKSGVSQLYGFSASELYGVAAGTVYRFDGGAWKSAFTAPGAISGGGATSNELVLAGAGGLVLDAK